MGLGSGKSSIKEILPTRKEIAKKDRNLTNLRRCGFLVRGALILPLFGSPLNGGATVLVPMVESVVGSGDKSSISFNAVAELLCESKLIEAIC